VQALAAQSGIALLFPAFVLTRTEPHRRESNAPSEDRKCWQSLELGNQDLKSWGRGWSR